MKIVFLVPDIAVCGGRYHSLEVARLLQLQGHKVQIISPVYNREDLKVFYNNYDVEIIEVKNFTTRMSWLPSLRRPLAYMQALYKFWESRNFWKLVPEDTDIIYAGFYSNAYAAYLAKKIKAPNAATVLSVQAPPNRDLWNSFSFAKPFYKKIAKSIDGITTVSQITKDSITTDLKVRSYNVGNGVDTELIKYDDDFKLVALKYNIPGDKRILLFLGGIHKIKGIEYLLPAFKKLNKKYNDLLLVMAGSSPYIDRYKSLARDMGLADQILWTGYIRRDENMAKLYSLSDVFVFPSLYESFGLPPLEAMACGRAVAVSDCGGPREYLIHEKNGIFFPPENSDGIVDAVSYLLDNTDVAKKIGDQGIKTAQKFRWVDVARKTEEAFIDIRERIAGDVH